MLRSVSDTRVSGQPFVINPIFNGGTAPAKPRTASPRPPSPPACGTTPTEVNEVTAPLIFTRRGSAGAGRFRGGLGQVIEVVNAEGAPGCVYIKGGADLRGKGQDLVPARAVMETPGGGIGAREERSPEAVAADEAAELT